MQLTRERGARYSSNLCIHLKGIAIRLGAAMASFEQVDQATAMNSSASVAWTMFTSEKVQV